MTRDAFWPVQPPAPTDRALRFPAEKVFLELTGRRCQPVARVVSPQGIGLVAQERCRRLPGLERPHPARFGSEGDGLEREDVAAGRFLACPAATAN